MVGITDPPQVTDTEVFGSCIPSEKDILKNTKVFTCYVKLKVLLFLKATFLGRVLLIVQNKTTLFKY